MGRRRQYHTKEEKAAAAAERSARYYKRNRESILERRKGKYLPKSRKERARLPPTPLTEEERKTKNNLKSKRCYERKRSDPKWAPNTKRQKNVPWSIIQSSNAYRPGWNKNLSRLNDLVTEAFKGKDLPDFIEGVALQYIETGLRGPLENASGPFLQIMTQLAHHETGVLNDIGAGAHLGDIDKVRKYVQHIVELLEHLVVVALERETVEGFLEVYQARNFMHHVLYFE